MSENNKSYRIHTKVDEGQEYLNINANLVQDYDILEVLSLKIGTENVYKLHTANYGCVVGRVLANGGVGVPNAKISIFIEQTEETSEDAILSYLYPYKSVRSKNTDGVRYNLLPEEQLTDCHRNVGGFPDKRLVLDDDNVLEIYDKYYKFTTRTNNAGDYLIFGVPTGDQMIHMDVDLSDIGILSQKPRDMIYKGYNITQFENANMFKKDTNLDSLTQIITQNSNVHVYPFWGESDIEDIKITRHDIELDYKFETTCVFMGSILTDDKDNGFTKKCFPTKDMGAMKKLITGEGTIEMIRKTLDGGVEALTIQGNQLIDGNGVWCYQIPMNLDYVYTDEVGNLVPTTDTSKGIPTRTRVRFRFSLNDFASDYQNNHLTKLLVPHNPSTESDLDYAFGSSTNDTPEGTGSFRDLLWNNVYSVKSYIPRLQGNSLGLSHSRDTRFSGFKNINAAQNVNHIPYNNLRVNITFKFLMQCFLFHSLILIVGGYNKMVKRLYNGLIKVPLVKNLVKNLSCLYIGGGSCEGLDNWYFAPNCEGKIADKTYDDLTKEQETIEIYDEEGEFKQYSGITVNDGQDKESNDYNNGGNIATETICLASKVDYFVKCTEIAMAMEEEIIQFDFYNDWINGLLYIPRWFATIRPKKSYFFGLFKREESIQACMQDNNVNKVMVIGQQCAPAYDIKGNEMKIADDCGQNCHKASGFKKVKFKDSTGFIKEYQTETNTLAKAYYPSVIAPVMGNKTAKLFATDIVLLGSLNETNIYGIPQTFKNLSTSTYQLPPNVAITTLYGDTYAYQGTDDRADCGEKIISGITELLPTADNMGIQGGFQDETEYPVVEMAGIDWTFDGPKQKKNESKKFYPSGHFIGMGCAHSQANIKSCVNLSRACEAGSMLSQRHPFIRTIEGNVEKYAYLHPTGLISYDEINDGGLRGEFATMNYNALKTKENENGVREYDFTFIKPTNFGGELSNHIDINITSNNSYNSPWFNENLNDDTVIISAATRTIETGDTEYLNYRFGGKFNTSKFLYNNNAMPVFENSYYFYFGKEEGNTSLNKLYKDYFAECPKLNPYVPHITVDVEEADACSEEPDGVIRIKLHNINGTATGTCEHEEFSKQIEINEGQGTGEFTGLSGNTTYKITVTGELFAEITQSVFVPNKDNGINVSFEINAFEEEIRFPNTPSGREKFTNFDVDGQVGNVEINISEDERVLAWGVFCETLKDGRYSIQFKNGAEHDSIVEFLKSKTSRDFNDAWWPQKNEEPYKFYVWQGNAEYIIFVVYQCADNYGLILNEIGKIDMPSGFNLYFGDNYNVLDNYMGLGGINDLTGTTWIRSALTIDTPESIRLDFLKALSFPWGRYDGTWHYGAIEVRPGIVTNGYTLSGYTENLRDFITYHVEDEDSDIRKYDIEKGITRVTAPCYGYDVSTHSVLLERQWVFNWKYNEGETERTAQTVIPYFYLPFFTNSIFVSYDTAESHKTYFSTGIVNGAIGDSDYFQIATYSLGSEIPPDNMEYHQRNNGEGPKGIDLEMPITGDSKYFTFIKCNTQIDTGETLFYETNVIDKNGNVCKTTLNIGWEDFIQYEKGRTDYPGALACIEEGEIKYYRLSNEYLNSSIRNENLMAIGQYYDNNTTDSDVWQHIIRHYSDFLPKPFEFGDFNLNMSCFNKEEYYEYDTEQHIWNPNGSIIGVIGIAESNWINNSPHQSNISVINLYTGTYMKDKINELSKSNVNLSINELQNRRIDRTIELHVSLQLKKEEHNDTWYIEFLATPNPNRWQTGDVLTNVGQSSTYYWRPIYAYTSEEYQMIDPGYRGGLYTISLDNIDSPVSIGKIYVRWNTTHEGDEYIYDIRIDKQSLTRNESLGPAGVVSYFYDPNDVGSGAPSTNLIMVKIAWEIDEPFTPNPSEDNIWFYLNREEYGSNAIPKTNYERVQA